MRIVTLKKNYNNKLESDYYTLIRGMWEGFTVAEKLQVNVEKIKHHEAQIVDCKNVFLDSLTDFATFLDIGTTADIFKQLFREAYPSKDFSIDKVSLLLLKKIPAQQNDKIAMFCDVFKEATGIRYIISPSEVGMISRVEVTAELLNKYFDCNEWWAKQKTITGYVKNFNTIRALSVSKNESGHPNKWDRDYLRTLTGVAISDYYKHLRERGLMPIKDDTGAIITWE